MPNCPKQPTRESSKQEILDYLVYQDENVQKTLRKLNKYVERLEKANDLFDELYGKKL